LSRPRCHTEGFSSPHAAMGASTSHACLSSCGGSPALHVKRMESIVLCENDNSDLSECDTSSEVSVEDVAGKTNQAPREASEEVATRPLLQPIAFARRDVVAPSSPPATSSAAAASALRSFPATTAVAPAVIVNAPAGKEQESDLLERCPKGPNCCDELTNAVRLVSLGCYCGPKLSFQKIGRGAETLPFDWIRTKIEGIFQLLRSDFDGFFHFDTELPVPNSGGMVCYRGKLHSFWHDDPTDPSMHERYNRRIARFNSIDAHSGLVLFVRVAGDTGELHRAPELLNELKTRFGDGARLLMVLNFQQKSTGPAEVRGHEGLLLNLLASEAHTRSSSSFGQPYAEAVRIALDWVVGREVGARCYDSLEAMAKDVTPDNWGKSGLGGLRAYEEDDASPAQETASPSSCASPSTHAGSP